MLAHSFDRFYVVTKFEMPKIIDLKLTTFSFDLTCNYLNTTKSYMWWYLKHCKRIAPYVKFYQKQIKYYNWTVYNILQMKIGPILATFGNRKNRFIATILGSVACQIMVLGLAFEGISSFLHNKRQKGPS